MEGLGTAVGFCTGAEWIIIIMIIIIVTITMIIIIATIIVMTIFIVITIFIIIGTGPKSMVIL